MKSRSNMPAQKENRRAGEEMKRAIDRTVEAEKNRDNFGNEQGQRDAAEELKRAAEKDTGKKASH